MNLHHDEVRKQRSTLAVCPSAKENVCVTDILYEIIEKETEKFWEDNDIFRKSMRDREGNEIYMFYDGPPTANGRYF